MAEKYYLGLDIGTDSVGWCASNLDYTIPKFRGNAMWGIRLFDKSNTAEERRAFRSARRRTQRIRERLLYLEIVFNEQISKADISFFQRLKDSSLYLEDKSVEGKYCVFNDSDFTDKDFHNKYPTIYHLRSELINDKSEKDIRLVYLALHHIIKNRGHFLFDSISADGLSDFKAIFENLCLYLNDNYDIEINCACTDELEQLLKDKTKSKTSKSAGIIELLSLDKKSQAAHILSLLSGKSEKLCDVFDDEALKEGEKKSIALSGNFDDTASEYEAILGERFELIELLKVIYDWAVLADILDGEQYISSAKVKIYNKHRFDLKMLKEYVRKYLPDKYNEIFKDSKDKLNNYVSYSGHIKHNGKTGVLENKSCSQEDFCAYLKKTLGKCADEKYSDMFSEIELGTFMPKQVSKSNSVIPMQLHRAELIAILDNAKGYLPFLNEKDESGLTAYDKIVSIFDYRIPYYVGPLNTHSDKHWLVRGEGKIYPWNIKDIVDFDKSAEAFIDNLTSKCSYLPDCDVIPKSSLLYSRFMVLNELNNLRLDGERIDVDLKQKIYTDLFEKHMKVTMKSLKGYLKSVGIDYNEISGVDGDFKASLKPLIIMNNYNQLDYYEKEEIIKAITIFGDDKKLLRKRIEKLFADRLSTDEIKAICKLKLSGWSKLSREFLSQVQCVHKKTGELVSIIDAMWQTNCNLMEVLYSDEFADINDEGKNFIDVINSRGMIDTEKNLAEIVDELYVLQRLKDQFISHYLLLRK